MKKIDKIIIGTHNSGKFRELVDLLPKKIVKISPKDLNLPSPKETGVTFEENSKIKAEYFSKKTNLVAISDDSGLAIDLLDGAPGIYSSRWAGSKNDFSIAINKIYSELKKLTKDPVAEVSKEAIRILKENQVDIQESFPTRHGG